LVQFVVCVRPVSLVDLLFPAVCLQLLGRHGGQSSRRGSGHGHSLDSNGSAASWRQHGRSMSWSSMWRHAWSHVRGHGICICGRNSGRGIRWSFVPTRATFGGARSGLDGYALHAGSASCAIWLGGLGPSAVSGSLTLSLRGFIPAIPPSGLLVSRCLVARGHSVSRCSVPYTGA